MNGRFCLYSLGTNFGSGVKWTEFSLIRETGYRVSSFLLAQSVCERAFSLLACECMRRPVWNPGLIRRRQRVCLRFKITPPSQSTTKIKHKMIYTCIHDIYIYRYRYIDIYRYKPSVLMPKRNVVIVCKVKPATRRYNWFWRFIIRNHPAGCTCAITAGWKQLSS